MNATKRFFVFLFILLFLFQVIPFPDSISASTDNSSTFSIETESIWDLEYDAKTETYTISLHTPGQNFSTLVIPSTIDGKHISALKDQTLSDCQINTLILPSEITLSAHTFSGASITNFYYQFSHIDQPIFQGTDNGNIKKFYLSGDVHRLPSSCFKDNPYIEEFYFYNSSSFIIDEMAFSGCSNLKKVYIAETVKNFEIHSLAFDHCTSLLEVYCHTKNTFLYPFSFSNCPDLKKVSIYSSVNIVSTASPSVENVPSIFYNCFSSSKDGNSTSKSSVHFYGDVTITYNSGTDFLSNQVTLFENCSGIFSVSFHKTITATNSALFINCKNVADLTFGGDSYLMDTAIQKCYELHTVTFHGILETTPKNKSIFHNCNIETLSWIPEEEKAMGNLLLGSVDISYLIIDAPYIRGELTSTTSVSKIIFPENVYEFESDTCLAQFKDNSVNTPTVYGYHTSNNDKNFIEHWCSSKNTNGTFQNIICDIKTYYTKNLVGSNLTSDDFDVSNIKTTACFAYDETKEPFSVSESTNEKKGFQFKTVDSILSPNEPHEYKISYSGISVTSTFYVEPLLPDSLSVSWDEEAIANLVAGQPVSASSIVTDAAVTFNNGDTMPLSVDTLDLSIIKNAANEDVFQITHKDFPSLLVEYKTKLPANYIISYSAIYTGSDLFVGDKLILSDFSVKALYHYDEDSNVPHTFKCTEISKKQVNTPGINQIVVSSEKGDYPITLYVNSILPVHISARFNEEDYQYFKKQDTIDPDSIELTITYNNKDIQTIPFTKSTLPCSIERIEENESSISAKIHYGDLESPIFQIPITQKTISKIQAKASTNTISSGAIINKRMITTIHLYYNDGTEEILNSNQINYNALTVSCKKLQDDSWNPVTITYAGASSNLLLWVENNPLTAIHATYHGTDYFSSHTWSVSDFQVEGIYQNGAIKPLTKDVTIQELKTDKTDEATFLIQYGSLHYKITIFDSIFSQEILEDSVNLNGSIETEHFHAPTLSPSPSSTATQFLHAETKTDSLAPEVSPLVESNNTVSSLQISSSQKELSISQKATPVLYTKKAVKINIYAVNLSKLQYQFVFSGQKCKKKQWHSIKSTSLQIKQTKKCGALYFRYMDQNNQWQQVHTNTFCIDTKKPSTNLKKHAVYPAGTKIICKDNQKLKFCKLDGKSIKSSYKITQKGKHRLVLKDYANNQKVLVFSIR